MDLKKAGEWDTITSRVRRFRREDLRSVDLADCIISYIDTSIFMCGTLDESFNAEKQHKPRFAIIKGGKVKCPNWLFAVFDWHDMIDSVEECVKKFVNIDNGTEPMGNEWVLFRDALI